MIAAVILAILIVWGLYLWGSRWAVEWYPAQTHHVRVSQTRHVVLYRVLPEGEARRRYPVIACHGLGANRFNMALPGKNSVAGHLARLGFDVFCLELSGSGQSRPKNARTPGRDDVHFEDFVRRDAPAAINRVLAETGADKVYWVGHSMGGMVAYAITQGPCAEKIAGACAVASPATLGYLRKSWLRSVLPLDFLFGLIPVIHNQFFTRLIVPYMHNMPGIVHRPMIRPDNLDREEMRRVVANVLADTPSSLLHDFSRWIKTRDISARDGESYEKGLAKIRTPFFLAASPGDLLVRPYAVEYAYERMGSEDKTYVVYKEAEGSTDYGHGDIIFGRNAPNDAILAVGQWLIDHDGTPEEALSEATGEEIEKQIEAV
ncbi:lysophospholipase [bacterium]|nr:lysophospholipase [bacterium]